MVKAQCFLGGASTRAGGEEAGEGPKWAAQGCSECSLGLIEVRV